MSEIAIPMLCLVAMSFLGWVFVLKTEIRELKNQNSKLRAKFELGIRDMTKDVELIKGRRSWGKKPKRMEQSMDTPAH